MGEITINPLHNVHKKYRDMHLVNPYRFAPAIPPFVSTWNTANTSSGSSTSTQVKLPLIAAGTYNFVVQWGDGNSDTITVWNAADTTHTYATSGTYTITITGVCTGFGFNLTGDRLKITSISSWGSLNLGSGSIFTFYNCSNLNLNSVSDILDLTGTTSLYGFIYGNQVTTTINRINEWDFSSVTNMESAFGATLLFNQALSFNSLNVTNMSGMFSGVKAFNSDITINTSKVTNMLSMFSGAIVFNKPLSFDTSKVTSMMGMFNGASLFNSALNFDTSSVTNMSQMFRLAKVFNQNIGSWNVSKVTSFTQMFIEDYVFNNGGSDSIKNWQINTLSSVNMQSMFAFDYAFNQPIGLWNTSEVTSMQSMFEDSTAFNQNIGSWNVSKVTFFANFMAGKTPAKFSSTNLDAIYNGWSTRPVLSGKTITFGSAKYTAASSAGRAILTSAPNNWTITDGGI